MPHVSWKNDTTRIIAPSVTEAPLEVFEERTAHMIARSAKQPVEARVAANEKYLQLMESTPLTEEQRQAMKRKSLRGGFNHHTYGAITQIWAHYREIVRRLALGEGVKRISEDLGLAESTIKEIRSSPLVQRKLSNLQDLMDANAIDVGQRIREVAPEALQVVEDIMTNPAVPAGIRLGAAKHMLGLGGYVPPKNVNVHQDGVICNVSFIERIKARHASQQESEVVNQAIEAEFADLAADA